VTRKRLVIPKIDFADQLLLKATRLEAAGADSLRGHAFYGGVAMLGYLLGAGLKGVGLVVAVVLVLGLVALIRCRREDIPAIVQALASWWRK
jgi:hypothetical protein